MFDKLIVSEPEGADFKNRRSYFMVSSLVVGVLFTTAVVISIYAADISLGGESFELVEMIAPVDPAGPAPERPQPPRPASADNSQSLVATRQANMSSVNEPTLVPTTTSTTPNIGLSREGLKYFKVGTHDANARENGSGRDPAGNQPGTGPSGLATIARVTEDEISAPPPPKRTPPANPPVKTMGVVNGMAKSLPKPAYPASAQALNIQGKVDVQVLIDEMGRVISARAVSGNPLLRNSAETAARNARFSSTLLSGVPVKVTGVIVYNFVK